MGSKDWGPEQVGCLKVVDNGNRPKAHDATLYSLCCDRSLLTLNLTLHRRFARSSPDSQPVQFARQRVKFGAFTANGGQARRQVEERVEPPFESCERRMLTVSVAEDSEAGATLQHPSWRGSAVEWESFPSGEVSSYSKASHCIQNVKV
jgi:hypothetical protein